MEVAKTISPQFWMTTPATRKVMDALGEGNALFVGGCVRNALLREEVTDIDIATKHHPEAVMKILKGNGIKVIPTGIEHGTVTAIVEDQGYEITTLRKDVETDGRRAVVAFADNWEDDAQRRDFTMNTLLADMSGNIYDPTGQGVVDLDARSVRFVGDPTQRITEDVLRILRFFRFHALYGKGELDGDALNACAQAADKIPQLSKERITQEFLKILSVDNPVDILEVMFDKNIIPQFRFPNSDLDTLEHLCTFQNRYGLSFIASRLYTLAGFSLENIKAMESLLLLPKVFKKDMQAIDAVLKLPDLADDHAVKVSIYKHGRVPTAQGLMIELAKDRVMNGYAPAAIRLIQNWEVPNFPMTGEDLMKEGIPQGPDLGAELSRREQAWIDNGFK